MYNPGRRRSQVMNNNVYYGNQVNGYLGVHAGSIPFIQQQETGTVISNQYFCQGKLLADISWNNIPSDIQINFVADLDPHTWIDISNHFKPNVSGYYLINLQTWFTDGSGNGQINCQINKNGTTQIAIFQSPMHVSSSFTGLSIGGSKIVYLNGTTDYVKFTGYSNSAKPQYIQSGSGTYFCASFISS